MSPHIFPGEPTVVHSLSPSLLVYLNTSKVPSLVPSADHSDIPSELHSYHPSIGKIILTSVMPTRDEKDTPIDAQMRQKLHI